MSGTGAFKDEGVIIEAMANGTYRAELANGHRVLAFVTGKAKLAGRRFAVGEKVKLALSPCDLSEGRILVENQAN